MDVSTDLRERARVSFVGAVTATLILAPPLVVASTGGLQCVERRSRSV